MKTSSRYRNNRTGQIVWFDIAHPEPGQRLTVTKLLGFDIAHDIVWYHPDDWSRSDATDGCATDFPGELPGGPGDHGQLCGQLIDQLLAAASDPAALQAVADEAERQARELEAEAARLRVVKAHAEHQAHCRHS